MTGRCSAVAAAVLAAAVSAGAERVHVVRHGESLWQIAEAVSGDPHRWQELYRANRDQIKDPQILHPGQRLTIPDAMDAATPTDPPEPSARQ